MSADAKERLSTLVRESHLGAGFEIAMRDLQIRGAGDILGVRQSGKTQEVGISLYLKLLEQKVRELSERDQGELSAEKPVECTIELPISSYIPDEYFDSESDKLDFFRGLEGVDDDASLEAMKTRFFEESASVPETIDNFFLLLRARLALSRLGIESVRQT